MTEHELLDALRSVDTMPKLDDLRKETAKLMMADDKATFDRVQGAFRKAKNRLNRVPYSERVGWY